MAILAYGNSPQIMQEWSAHPSAWQDVLKHQGIDPEKAQEKLKIEGVEIFFDESLMKVPQKEERKNSSSPHVLHDYGDVSVYYAPDPRVRNHLWIVLNREVEHLKEVSGDEAVLMQSTVNKICEIFQEKFGVPHVNVVTYQKPQQGQPLNKWVIELLPPNFLQAFDVLQKIQDNQYAILRKTDPFPAFDDLEIMASDIAIWKQAFAENSERLAPSQKESPAREWILTSKNHAEAQKACLDCIYTALLEHNVPMQRVVFAKPSPSPLISVTKKMCAFCNEAITSSQQILETKHFRLLCNHKSPIDPIKILVVSKRHVEQTTGLSEEEVKDKHELIQQIVRNLEKKKELKICSILTQEGPLVGQTEPHTHTHLLIDFSPLQFHLHHIDYANQKPKSSEEMKSAVQNLQKIFLDGSF